MFKYTIPKAYPIPKPPTAYDSSINGVGIDLGTTRSCTAVNKNNKIDVISVDNDQRPLLSFVGYEEVQPKCGSIVARRMTTYSQNTVFDVKRIIGKSYDTIVIDPFWPFKVIRDAENVKIQTQNYNNSSILLNPEEISAVLLKHMKQKADEYKHTVLKEAVLTVPVAFNQNQIDATLEAAALAGWETIHILPEPIAACFTYASENEIPKDSYVLLFDLGGGTLDICIVRIENNELKILKSYGDLYIGGRNFDTLLMNHFMLILKRVHNIDIRKNNYKKYKLLLKCQEIKHDLEAVNEVSLDVADFDCESDAHIPITRAEFKELSHEILVRLNARIIEALDTLKVLPNQINYVLQAGGGCRMLMVKELLKNIFPLAQHRSTVDPDWAVAYGASLYCCHIKSLNSENESKTYDKFEKLISGKCIGWDCGSGAIRIANMDIQKRPTPLLITNQEDERHFLAITSMRVPQIFNQLALSHHPAHIIMDAFRCQPTKSNCLFCVKREHDKYEIPAHRRLMINNPTPEDLKEHGIGVPHQMYKHEEIMATIIQEISKAFNVHNVVQKEAYLCVPDAAPLEHIRKLRRAFIKVFEDRQKAKMPKDVNKWSQPSDPPAALPNEVPLTPSNIFFIQRTAAAIQMYFHRRSGVKVYDHNREQFHREDRIIPVEPIILPRTVVVIAFGAGHFSSAIYKQETFERYGIRHIFSKSDDALGGEDLCYRLCEYVLKNEKLDDEAKEALQNRSLLKKLRNTMEKAKTDLSKKSPAIVDVEVNDEKVVTLTISREEFEMKIAKKEFDKIEYYTKELKKVCVNKSLDVTDILLVRGSTRTKKILELVDQYFPDVPIAKCLNTDECIAMGTALKGALKNGIHRTAYAEVEDVAMQNEHVEINGIKLFLTKEFESVQNSKEHWIEPLGGHNITYNGHEIKFERKTKFTWKRDVACDPCIMTNGRIDESMTKCY